MSSRLDAMRAALSKTKGDEDNGGTRPGRYYPMSKVEFDQSLTVRFLPDTNPDNTAGFFREVLTHNLTVNGQDKRIPCLEMWGEQCPIGQQSRQFYDADDSTNGSKYWKKRTYVSQVLVIDDPLKLEVDPTNPIKILSFGTQVMSVIREAIFSGEFDADPDAYEGGYNFVLKKTKAGPNPRGGFFPAYNVGTRFVSKPSNIPEELRAVIDENRIDLETLIPAKPDVNSVMADLQASLNSSGPSSRSFSSGPAATPAVTPAQQPAAAPAASATKLSDTTSDLLARLKRTNVSG